MSTHHHRTDHQPNKWLGWLTGLAAIAVVAIGLSYFYSFNQVTYSDDAQVQQLLAPVNARVGGYITKINFVEFQQVKKGDTLVVIDNTDYLVQQQLAEANLLDALAGKHVTRSSVTTAENTVTIATSNLQETNARVWNAEKNLRRYETLLAQESVTQQQYDQVKSDYDALIAKLSAMQNAENGNRLAVKETGAKIQVNDAAIKRAQAQLKAAKLNVLYTIILAPCDGYIGRKNITEGQLVQAGQQLAAVVNNEEKWLTVNIKEKQLQSLAVGKKARVQIDAIDGYVFTATITSIAGATGSVFSLVPTDNSTGNFVKIQQRVPVRLDFMDVKDQAQLTKLKAGMNAVVYFDQKP
ncbi:HlyD family secretion protein [Dyadobacter bucti]|uniref:HlyD family secretion protein n=1 Tax=Dyadobacter bucti TaxID=2572203 RepID=UPI001108B43F|nr:HlyD family secretion protein [Dyadobacter bucti]